MVPWTISPFPFQLEISKQPIATVRDCQGDSSQILYYGPPAKPAFCLGFHSSVQKNAGGSLQTQYSLQSNGRKSSLTNLLTPPV